MGGWKIAYTSRQPPRLTNYIMSPYFTIWLFTVFVYLIRNRTIHVWISKKCVSNLSLEPYPSLKIHSYTVKIIFQRTFCLNVHISFKMFTPYLIPHTLYRILYAVWEKHGFTAGCGKGGGYNTVNSINFIFILKV